MVVSCWTAGTALCGMCRRDGPIPRSTKPAQCMPPAYCLASRTKHDSRFQASYRTDLTLFWCGIYTSSLLRKAGSVVKHFCLFIWLIWKNVWNIVDKAGVWNIANIDMKICKAIAVTYRRSVGGGKNISWRKRASPTCYAYVTRKTPTATWRHRDGQLEVIEHETRCKFENFCRESGSHTDPSAFYLLILLFNRAFFNFFV